MSFYLRQINYNWKKVGDIFKRLSEKRKGVKFKETIKRSQTKSEADMKDLSRTDQTTKPILNSYDFNKSQKISDIKKLINENERRLQKLKEKQARLGPDTRPADLLEIEDTELEIEKLQAQLKELEDDDEN